jgi:hypothetical protein
VKAPARWGTYRYSGRSIYMENREATRSRPARNFESHCTFTWEPGMRRVGLRRAVLYLLRPDGYIGQADPHADPKRLRPYFMDAPTATTVAKRIT